MTDLGPQPQPQYKIAFFTNDKNLFIDSFNIRHGKYTHEHIYRKGLEAVKKELADEGAKNTK